MKFTFFMQEPDIGGWPTSYFFCLLEKKGWVQMSLSSCASRPLGRLRNKVEQEPANIDRLLSSPLIGATCNLQLTSKIAFKAIFSARKAAYLVENSNAYYIL